MGKTQRQRDLMAAYKEREVVGGVCAIRHSATGRTLVLAVPDPKGQRNRFAFSVSTGSCVHTALAADWTAGGGEAFTFAVLEELPKKPERTDKQFREDLDALADLWRERLAAEGTPLY